MFRYLGERIFNASIEKSTMKIMISLDKIKKYEKALDI